MDMEMHPVNIKKVFFFKKKIVIEAIILTLQ